jgi:hypothetical protein
MSVRVAGREELAMIYRGFKIERTVHPSKTGDTSAITGAVQIRAGSKRHVEYIVSETIAGFHWQEIGSANNRKEAKAMVDRIADVREALSREVKMAI